MLRIHFTIHWPDLNNHCYSTRHHNWQSAFLSLLASSAVMTNKNNLPEVLSLEPGARSKLKEKLEMEEWEFCQDIWPTWGKELILKVVDAYELPCTSRDHLDLIKPWTKWAKKSLTILLRESFGRRWFFVLVLKKNFRWPPSPQGWVRDWEEIKKDLDKAWIPHVWFPRKMLGPQNREDVVLETPPPPPDA